MTMTKHLDSDSSPLQNEAKFALRRATLGVLGGVLTVATFATSAVAGQKDASQAAVVAMGPTPQALAVVASAGDMSMHCQGAECALELTTICLEPERASPVRGLAYTPYDGVSGFTVKATLRSGEEVSLDPEHALEYEALRGHSSVLASIKPDVVRALGVKSATLSVTTSATLMPVLWGNPDDAHTEAELKEATGPNRALAADILQKSGAKLAATRITNQMINAIPPGRRTPAAAVGGSGLSGAHEIGLARDAAMRAATQEGSHATEGLAIAEEALQRCSTYGFSTLRDCLSAMHDGFIGKLNNRYWDSLKPVF